MSDERPRGLWLNADPTGSWSLADQEKSPSRSDPALAVLVVRDAAGAQKAVRGDLDILTAPQLTEALEVLFDALTADLELRSVAQLGATGRGAFMVDLRDVGVLCAAGINVLAAAHARLAVHGGRLKVAGARPLAVRCLVLLGLQELLP